jgi:hypothetical protein
MSLKLKLAIVLLYCLAFLGIWLSDWLTTHLHLSAAGAFLSIASWTFVLAITGCSLVYFFHN